MSAYVSPPGFHRHRCFFCATVWEHHDTSDLEHGTSGAHECPNCRRCNWSLGIYTGEEPPVIHHGVLPPVSEEEAS